MIVTKLLCPHVGCASQVAVKAPYDEGAIEAARSTLRKHRSDQHRSHRSLDDCNASPRWEYDNE